MLLAIDIGNSQITIGIFKEEQLLGVSNWQTFSENTREYYQEGLRGILLAYSQNKDSPIDVVMASVVPQVTRQLEQAVKAELGRCPLIAQVNWSLGLTYQVKEPAKLGVDRIIDALGAKVLYAQDCVVVDVGTATTVDAVTVRGDFLGGMICPGPLACIDALVERTALLTKVPFAKPPSAIGKNTQECMQAGIYYGYLGLLQRTTQAVIDATKENFSDTPQVILTGGWARTLTEDFEQPHICDEWLTLKGLRIAYELNRNPS